MEPLPKRKEIRLPDYDYSESGYYFVTIVIQHRETMFGEIVHGRMILNDAGEMINQWWKKLPEKFNGIEIDVYQIMPNHFHGIIGLTNDNGRTHGSAPTDFNDDNNTIVGVNPRVDPSLGMVIQWFKTMSTNEYIRNVKQNGWKPFNKRLWQRNYYEHVIRNDRDLMEIQQYILDNPMEWELDDENPNKKKLNILHP